MPSQRKPRSCEQGPFLPAFPAPGALPQWSTGSGAQITGCPLSQGLCSQRSAQRAPEHWARVPWPRLSLGPPPTKSSQKTRSQLGSSTQQLFLRCQLDKRVNGLALESGPADLLGVRCPGPLPVPRPWLLQPPIQGLPSEARATAHCGHCLPLLSLQCIVKHLLCARPCANG